LVCCVVFIAIVSFNSHILVSGLSSFRIAEL
jgi:hypothetical protein